METRFRVLELNLHLSSITKNWLVVSNIFYFHPYLGKWSNLTNTFQMSWFNHQLEKDGAPTQTYHRNLAFSGASWGPGCCSPLCLAQHRTRPCYASNDNERSWSWRKMPYDTQRMRWGWSLLWRKLHGHPRVDGWNPANSPVDMVVYPIICKVLYIPGGVEFLPSKVVILHVYSMLESFGNHLPCE